MIPIGILAGARVAAGSTYESAVLADSPTWYFPLNDVSGPPDDQMNYATASTAGTVAYGAAGLGDRSTSIDLQAARIIVGVNPLGFTQFTAECLVRFDTVGTAYRNIMTKDSTSFRVYILRSTPAAKLEAILFNSSGSPVFVPVGTTTLTAATNYHIALTFDGSTTKVYLNGVVESTLASVFTINPTIGTVNHVIGGDHDNFFVLDGKMAGAAFYTTALSGARILAHSIASGH
jgi:hypothetical protein